MVVERRRKYLDGRVCSKVEEGRPSGERSALAETPHETDLRIALYAARIDAIVVGCGAIAVEAKMNTVLSDRDVPADDRCRCPQQKWVEPRLPLSVCRSRRRALLRLRCGRSRLVSRNAHPQFSPPAGANYDPQRRQSTRIAVPQNFAAMITKRSCRKVAQSCQPKVARRNRFLLLPNCNKANVARQRSMTEP